MEGRPINHVIVPLFLLEATATGCLAVIFYYLKYLDNFHQRRFPLSCADVEWISYPYYSSTSALPLFLDDPALYSASFFIPFATVLVMEIIRWFFYQGEKKVVQAGWPNWKLHFFPRRVVRIIGTLLFGMLLTCVLVLTLKYMFAIPRPHFLQVCQPNITALDLICSGDIYNRNSPTSATFTPSDTTCLASAHDVDAALRSFPSEHAALPAFCGVFLASYFHKMTGFRRLVTVRPSLVALALIAAVTPGIGTLHAFRNRWEDLLAGYLLGAAIAVYITAVSLRGFADVRVPLAPTANLLRLSGLNGTGDFKSVPSVATVEEPTLLNLSGLDGKRETPSIPRARSNTTGNIYEAANKIMSRDSTPYIRRFSSPRRGF